MPSQLKIENCLPRPWKWPFAPMMLTAWLLLNWQLPVKLGVGLPLQTRIDCFVGANGHFHGRGKQFSIYNWDGKAIAPDEGQKFYESRTWDEPPMLRSPDLKVAVVPGGGIQYSCSFQWTPPAEAAGGCAALDAYDVLKHPDVKTPDCCYTFGPIVEKNEHCNAFVYYYPKQAASDVNCF